MTREHTSPVVEVLLAALGKLGRDPGTLIRRFTRLLAFVLYACASTPPPEVREPSPPQQLTAASSGGVSIDRTKLDPLPEVKQHGFDPRQYYDRRALYELNGVASWYGESFAGRPTANGERYDPNAYTAAHRSLPFGTIVRVTRRSTGDWVLVRINDRGPFGKRGRILDLSKQAARRLGMLHDGIAKVRAEVLEEGRRKKR